MSISAGTRLGGKYELVRQLGEGGMGVVWLARHVELGTEVAVKVLRTAVLGDKEAVTRFDREARAAASLRGPHITRILDVGRHDDGSPFMVMEYLDGCDLGAEIAAHGALPIAEAIGFVVQACEGMSEAHARGVVHRDLKPENLFLIRAGGRREVKILDFGISKFHADGDLRVTQTQTSFGTPLYMSPEQVRSTKNVDHRTDLWSLGVILYEALTGEPPFLGETPTAVAVAVTVDSYPPVRSKRPDVPEALEAVIARALEKDPAKRYQTADELADALEGFSDAPHSAVPSRAAPLEPRVAVTNTMRVSSVDVPVQGGAKRGSPLLIVGVALGMGASILVALVALRGHRSSEALGAPSPSGTTVMRADTQPGPVATTASPASSPSANADRTEPQKPDVGPSPDPVPSQSSPPTKPSAAASATSEQSKVGLHPATSAKSHDPPPHTDPPVAKPASTPERNPQFL